MPLAATPLMLPPLRRVFAAAMPPVFSFDIFNIFIDFLFVFFIIDC
jgi:hypothetical protein